MSQSRKQKIIAQTRRHRQRRAVLTILLAAALIAIITVGVYFFAVNNKTIDWRYPCLGQESLTFHIHPWLRIWINNGNITIPAGIGIQGAIFENGIATRGSCFEPMHTHDASGIIHIESPDTSVQYTLDSFFQIWRLTYPTITIDGVSQPVVFNSTNILGFKTDQTHRVSLLVDSASSNAYGSLALNKYDYCDSSVANVPPCFPTAGGDPYYGGQPYPYGTKHTVTIVYATSG